MTADATASSTEVGVLVANHLAKARPFPKEFAKFIQNYPEKGRKPTSAEDVAVQEEKNRNSQFHTITRIRNEFSGNVCNFYNSSGFLRNTSSGGHIWN
ncbi:hypothetical protein AVEN_149661-1 [Araneus ventricosus]|uniref:Uncharacterized protein n=1 Tax=Araneus ventricosus TaxID=182803 RepID=A0A4Y2RZ86_ARAVE|nr:hypothetical protein AVEN_149661-1 [Araneus ventricosus]